MKIVTDLHCHTLASAHAYSTIYEIAQCAKDKGLEAVAITDHGISMSDAPHLWYFVNLKAVPKELFGVRIFHGCEANIAEKDGTLDMPEGILKKLDIVVASIHEHTYHPEQGGDHTAAYLAALENPYVDILGHTNRPEYPYEYAPVLLKAKELHKLIEINANYLDEDHIGMAREIALQCKALGVSISVDSDSHFCTTVGNVEKAAEMLWDIEFPEELIANRSLRTLREYFAPRKTIK